MRARLDGFPRFDGLGLSLGLNWIGGPVVDGVAGCAPCRLPDQDAVDRCVRLEPRRRVDDVAGDHALALLRPRAERDERLPGVDADTELELGLLVEDPVADRECCSHRALGVVVVRDRGAEHGHHGVADELLDRAPEALELVAQPRMVGPEQRAHLLGIHALGARGEADEVGEEDGDDLALLEPRLLVDREWRRAGVAEARAVGILLAAAGTGKHHREAYGERSQGSRRAVSFGGQ